MSKNNSALAGQQLSILIQLFTWSDRNLVIGIFSAWAPSYGLVANMTCYVSCLVKGHIFEYLSEYYDLVVAEVRHMNAVYSRDRLPGRNPAALDSIHIEQVEKMSSNRASGC